MRAPLAGQRAAGAGASAAVPTAHTPACIPSLALSHPAASLALPLPACPARAGNGGSLEKCRRRWDLCDADFLRYKFLNAFDRAMTHLDKAFGFMSAPHQWVSRKVRAGCFGWRRAAARGAGGWPGGFPAGCGRTLHAAGFLLRLHQGPPACCARERTTTAQPLTPTAARPLLPARHHTHRTRATRWWWWSAATW